MSQSLLYSRIHRDAGTGSFLLNQPLNQPTFDALGEKRQTLECATRTFLTHGRRGMDEAGIKEEGFRFAEADRISHNCPNAGLTDGNHPLLANQAIPRRHGLRGEGGSVRL